MKVFKYLYCPDCKYRKEVATESRNPTCTKCNSNARYSENWSIRWYVDGKPQTKVIPGGSKRDAERARDDAKDGKEYIRLSRKAPILFGAACDQYLEHCKHQAGYENKVHHLKHFKTFWEKKPVYEVSPEAIRTEHNRMSQEISPSTANRYLATLKALFTFAENNGHIDYTVLHGIRKVRMFEENNERQRYLTVNEYHKLIKACNESPCIDLTDIINFAIFTGLRQANILGCRYDSHIDIENGLLKYTAAEVKGKRAHIIPIASILENMIRRRPRGLTSPYLFFRHGQPYTRFQIDHYFKQALSEAKIKDFRFHDLRHTLASWLAMSGAGANHIQQILGHADLKMSQRYTHLSVEHKRAAIGAVESVFLGE